MLRFVVEALGEASVFDPYPHPVRRAAGFPTGPCPILANRCSLLVGCIGRRVGTERTTVPETPVVSEPAELLEAIVALRRVTSSSLLCDGEKRAASAFADLLEAALPETPLRSVPTGRREFREAEVRSVGPGRRLRSVSG